MLQKNVELFEVDGYIFKESREIFISLLTVNYSLIMENIRNQIKSSSRFLKDYKH